MRIAGIVSAQEARRILTERSTPAARGGDKFGAIKVSNEHGKFDSKHEASFAGKFIILRDGGFIENLKLDKRELKFAFDVEGVRIGEYTADASFVVVRDFELMTLHGPVILRAGRHCVCDAKSKATRKIRDYPLRRNLLFALHRLEILEL